MFNTINYADVEVTLHFKDGKELTLYINGDNDSDDVNEIDGLEINYSLSASSSNPMGSVASNTLSLDISSYDDSLDPNNKNSIYYGMMNRTAYITVKITKLYIEVEDEDNSDIEPEQDVDVMLGTFYVSDWTSNASSGDIHGVCIEACDLISSVANLQVPIVSIDVTQGFSDYIKKVVSALNKTLPKAKKIVIDKETILSEWDSNKLFHRNLATSDNFGGLLEQVSKCLMTNIYMNQYNRLAFDSMLDDDETESVYTMSDDTNITDISVGNALLVDYSGVNIKHPVGKTETGVSLSTIDEITNDSDYSNVSLEEGTHKLDYVVITSSTTECPDIDSLLYDNSKMNLKFSKLPDDFNGSVSVGIFGSKQKKDYITTEPKYADDDSKDSILTLENDILDKKNISKYQKNILAFMNSKRSSISCSGAFDPRLKLGDIVTVESTLLGMTDIYKAVSLALTIDANLNCDAEVIKVTKTVE